MLVSKEENHNEKRILGSIISFVRRSRSIGAEHKIVEWTYLTRTHYERAPLRSRICRSTSKEAELETRISVPADAENVFTIVSYKDDPRADGPRGEMWPVEVGI